MNSAVTTPQCRAHSHVALESLTQIIIDIARSYCVYHGADVEIISPVCNFVVRHTLQHIYRKRYDDSDAWYRDTDILRQSLDKLEHRLPASQGPFRQRERRSHYWWVFIADGFPSVMPYSLYHKNTQSVSNHARRPFPQYSKRTRIINEERKRKR
jgi:hypothetical protein